MSDSTTRTRFIQLLLVAAGLFTMAVGGAVAGLGSASVSTVTMTPPPTTTTDASASLVTTSTAPPPRRVTDPASLVIDVERQIAAFPSTTCVAVDLDRAPLVRHRAGDPLIPASTMKMATATAAIEVFGAPAVVDRTDAMLAESANEIADALAAELSEHRGGPATPAAGAQATMEVLTELGIPLDGVSLVDGSGLSRHSRFTCEALVAIVNLDLGGALVPGLATAGLTGTLAERMVGTVAEGRVRAKTGSLPGVAGLAGVVDTDGGRITFAAITNGVSNRMRGEALLDALAVRLAVGPDERWEPA
ncbi:MAG TPA: D-alanyl-D-alanine carboxypeptidase [Acidimicrobiales bacterium]|jgi:D-alanyl-D-alanine carboxypeptidase